MKWIKEGNAKTVAEFIKEQTGTSLEELIADPGHYFLRFKEVEWYLKQAKERGQKIVLVGDYDADGIDSVLIMANVFVALGLKFQLIIPRRCADGYGVSVDIVDRIDEGSLLITIDNGISAVDAFKRAREKNMNTIILDHHEGPDELPEVDVLIDPTAVGEADYTRYCGAGIAYRLAGYLLGENHELMKELSCYAAIATIGDVMPLTGDNRIIVQDGLQNMKELNASPALKYLLAKANMLEHPIAMDIAFYVVPIINASERLYDGGAVETVQALYKKGMYEPLVDKLFDNNQKRKDVTTGILTSIDINTLMDNDDSVIFLRNDNIPAGMVGIVAGQICEETGKPTFVFTKDEVKNVLKASARSKSEDFSIIEIIQSHKDLLAAYGGHKKAAGLSVTEENYEAFKVMMLKDVPLVKKSEEAVKWHLEVNDLTLQKTVNEILALEPVGEGLPAPRIKMTSRIKNFKACGADGNTVRFELPNMVAIAFRSGETLAKQLEALPHAPKFVELIGRVSENYYRGKSTPQIIIDDFRLS